MKILLWVHIAAGVFALFSGVVAVAARKGNTLHIRAGNWFAATMLVLGITASLLEPFRSPPGSPLSGILVCYFIATGWWAAHRRDGATGVFEIATGVIALGFAALTAWGGFTGSTTPAGRGPVFAIAALCLLDGLLDLSVVRRTLSQAARISRHLWRMCFAFFIATGSFFLAQQQILPVEVRGSPILFVLAFAPFAAMAFWLVRVRLGKRFRRAETFAS